MATREERLEPLATRMRAPLPARLLKGLSNFIVRKPLGAFGAFIILAMVFMALTAPWISGDPNKWHISDAMYGPSSSTGSVRMTWARTCGR